MANEPASREFVTNEIGHLKELINEKFASRDKAIELLASKIPLLISITGLLAAVYAIFKGHS